MKAEVGGARKPEPVGEEKEAESEEEEEEGMECACENICFSLKARYLHAKKFQPMYLLYMYVIMIISCIHHTIKFIYLHIHN